MKNKSQGDKTTEIPRSLDRHKYLSNISDHQEVSEKSEQDEEVDALATDDSEQNISMISNSAANFRLFSLMNDYNDQHRQYINFGFPRVLVICTGGTLTMVHTPKGYMS
jgi:hypothetical protein